MQTIRLLCFNLSLSMTGTGVLDWFDLPLLDLIEWGKAIEQAKHEGK